jgi:hypothetical protein
MAMTRLLKLLVNCWYCTEYDRKRKREDMAYFKVYLEITIVY